MSLLENIIFKSQKINFDMSKSLNENLSIVSSNVINVPVKPKAGTWEEINNSLFCNFSFNNISHIIYFVSQILEKAKSIRHMPDIQIQDSNVSIYLQTKDLQQITETDILFSKFINDIYEDIKFIRDF